MIRLATKNDIAAVAESYDQLLKHEQINGGFSNWILGVYPTIQVAEEAVKNGRFAVYRAEGVAYSASLESAAAEYGITEDYIIESFRLIRNDWQTGET